MRAGASSIPQRRRPRSRRRGVVAVQVVIMLVVILGFAALTIDIGNVYRARGELQRASDSGALAGVSAFLGDNMLEALQSGYDGAPDPALIDPIHDSAGTRAVAYSEKNNTLQTPTKVEDGDVVLGHFDFSDPGADLDAEADPANFNAVALTVRRTSDGTNGGVPYWFARVFGLSDGQSAATATAAFDDRFSGYREDDRGNYLIPFTIHIDEYENQFHNGDDDWSYDGGNDDVNQTGDGIREIKLFPYKLSGGGNGNNNGNGNGNGNGKKGGGGGSTGDDGDQQGGSGNFGLLNIGNPNQGVPLIEDQIIDGVTADNLEAEVGTNTLTFFDEDGDEKTYDITGSPGMKVGVEDAVEERIGDIVGFFVHDQVTDGGANCTYRVVGIRFGRLLHIDLTGNPDDKAIIIQPVIFNAPNILTNPNAAPSGGQVGRLSLVR